jgi:serine protease Do
LKRLSAAVPLLCLAICSCQPAPPKPIDAGMLAPALGLPDGTAKPVPEPDPDLPDFSALFLQASPAVVNVSAAHALPIPDGLMPRRQRSVFKAMARSLGSGFVFDVQGHVVTCSSVIQDADDIQVILADGRHLSARVLAVDDVIDLALLEVDADRLPRHLPIAPAGQLKAGDWVAAFGYPYGLSHSITAGIVSATRSAQSLGSSCGLVLSDTSINPGCNGGPLLDIQGRVVGINLISGRTEGGLGLAIPIHDALPVLQELQKGHSPRRAWLGVSIQHVDAALAESFGLESAEGALVTRLESDGPAERAGLQIGDIIVSFSGRRVEDPMALIEAAKRSAVGRRVRLSIVRDAERKQIWITPKASR